MKSETSLVASKVRLQNWALQIQDCQNRPAGMSVDDWCEQNGMKKSLYYYRLRRLCESCFDVITRKPEQEFVELPVAPVIETHSAQQTEGSTIPRIAAVLRCGNGLSLEILDHVSASFLHQLLEEFRHAE